MIRMIIDEVYEKYLNNKNVSKSNFYFGKVSRVTPYVCNVQVENLTLVKSRNFREGKLFLNEVNEFVVIDSLNGTYIARTLDIKVKDTDSVQKQLNKNKEKIVFPIMTLQVLGKLRLFKGSSFKIEQTGLDNPNLNDKVYILPEHAISDIISTFNLVEYGVNIDNVFKISKESDDDLCLSTEALLNRHLMVVGTTGSGKSTTSASIIEELIEKDAKFLIIDPTGEYKGFDNLSCDLLNVEKDLKIGTADIGYDLWKKLLSLNENTQEPTLIAAIKMLKSTRGRGLKKEGKKVTDVEKKLNSYNDCQNFSLENLEKQIIKESVTLTNGGKRYRFEERKVSYNSYLIDKIRYFKNIGFSKYLIERGTNNNQGLKKKIDDFIKGDKSLYIDCSGIGDDKLGTLIVNFIGKYIVDKLHDSSCQETLKTHPFVIFMDEIHRFIDKENVDFVTIAREGRKYGVFLFMTTQSPLDVSPLLMSQIGTFIIHRLAHPNEVNLMENFMIMNKGILRRLGQGEAVISSINFIDDICVKVNKPRNLTHETDTPIICKEKSNN